MIQTTGCKVCGKWFAYDDEPQVSCCVQHPKGSCCHYQQREIAPPLTTTNGRGASWRWWGRR